MSDNLQYLFVYGTLKSSHPEHARHCTPPIGIETATACGHLWRIREGYPILQIDPALVLAEATPDPAIDWKRAEAIARSGQAPNVEGPWIEGERFAYPLADDVLASMDSWEGFVPGQRSIYQRRIIWTKDSTGADRPAWAYVCQSPPNWSTMVNAISW